MARLGGAPRDGGDLTMPNLLPPARALALRDEARESAARGNPSLACFQLGWAAVSLRAAGEAVEELRTRLLLAWAQDLDGRPWQAVRTMRACLGRPEYPALPAWVRSRSETSLSRALWAIGSYSEARDVAIAARDLADGDLETAWAELAVAHALLYLGQHAAAERSFREAERLEPSLKTTARIVRAYLHNLRGEHGQALALVEDEPSISINRKPQSLDELTRAAEHASLSVERCTAKAFLRHRDARQAVLEALAAAKTLGAVPDLELARIHRAWAVVLGHLRESRAAEAYLHAAGKVFRQRSAQPEQDLMAVAVSIVNHERR
jgi:tetratricopeptide (TPR) repeat protein